MNIPDNAAAPMMINRIMLGPVVVVPAGFVGAEMVGSVGSISSGASAGAGSVVPSSMGVSSLPSAAGSVPF